MSRYSHKVKRTFVPGDEWLFFKVYCGVKTCDELLVKKILPLAHRLIREKIIVRWFFIRYSDPDYHLRVRFLLSSTDDIGHVMAKTRKSLSTYLKNNEVSKVVIDTYQREIERYGSKYIELSEQVFHAGSECVATILKHLKENSALRWRAAFLIVDALLSKLGLSLEKKKELIERMNESFLKEFNFNIHNSKSLNDAYRIKRKSVSDLVSGLDTDEMDSLMRKHVNTYAKEVVGIIRDIPIDKLSISSYIHMEMNRLFVNNNRLNEMVLYNYLTRYYKSEIAKAKSQNN
jgi:thiopeptide-type bacteriocin biosynthesis protein